MSQSHQGQDSAAAALDRMIAKADEQGLDIHAVVVRQHGEIVAEAYKPPFDAETPHRMYSVTKSFTSSAVGLAVADGLLRVEDRLVDLLPDFAPNPVGDNLAALKVHHLLTMTAEHGSVGGVPVSRPSPSIASYMRQPMRVPPGTRYEYSDTGSYVLSALVQHLTGEPIHDYLRPRLFEPLDIAANHWLKSAEGACNGGWGLHLTARELSRFGQMLLQNGMWEGRQILPADWVSQATRKQVASWGASDMPDWHQGYGYQFWRGRHASFRADGLLGQYCIMLPEHDAVLTVTAGTMQTPRLFELFWGYLLPALAADDGGVGEATGFADLETAEPNSPRAGEFDGITFTLGEQFMLPSRFYGGQAPITAMKLDRSGEGLAVLAMTGDSSWRLPVGINGWAGGTTTLSTDYPEPYQGFARWTAPDRLAIDMVFTEAGFRLDLVFALDPLELSITLPANPGFDRRLVRGRTYP